MSNVTPSPETDRARARVMATMIRATLIPAWFNAALLAFVLCSSGSGLTGNPPWQLVMLTVLLVWQLLLAWRLNLDARWFHEFASDQLQPEQLDHVLAELSIRPAPTEQRSMLDRVLGARGLIRLQGFLAISGACFVLIVKVLATSSPHV